MARSWSPKTTATPASRPPSEKVCTTTAERTPLGRFAWRPSQRCDQQTLAAGRVPGAFWSTFRAPATRLGQDSVEFGGERLKITSIVFQKAFFEPLSGIFPSYFPRPVGSNLASIVRTLFRMRAAEQFGGLPRETGLETIRISSRRWVGDFHWGRIGCSAPRGAGDKNVPRSCFSRPAQI